jgi:hypothetical protein
MKRSPLFFYIRLNITLLLTHTPLAAPQHVITPKAQRNPSQLDSARAHKSGATIAEVEELMVVLLALVGL